MASYNPFPATFNTFGKQDFDKKAGKQPAGKVNYLGTAKRFKEEDKKKKKDKGTGEPGPGTYDILS